SDFGILCRSILFIILKAEISIKTAKRTRMNISLVMVIPHLLMIYGGKCGSTTLLENKIPATDGSPKSTADLKLTCSCRMYPTEPTALVTPTTNNDNVVAVTASI